MNARDRRRTTTTATTAAALALLTAACGIRVSHQAVERAAGRLTMTGTDSGAVAGTATGTSGEGATGPVSAAAPSSAAGGAATGAAAGGGSRSSTGGAGGAKASAVGTSAATGSPIAVGNVGTYSGVVGSSTASAEPMVKVWAQWVNQHGGINGHPVVVYTADDGGDPSKSRALSQQMVENNHVVAFVGDMISSTAGAVGTYADSAHVPVVGGDLTTPDWNEHAMLFPQGTGAIQLYEGAAYFDAKFVAQAGGNKWGAVYCVEDAACETSYKHTVAVAPKAGLNPVYGEGVTLTQPSYTAQCLNAQSKGVNILELTLDANSVSRIARDCASQGYKPLYASGGVIVTSNLAQDAHLDRLVSIESTFGWTFGGSPAAKEYQDAVQALAPNLAVSSATSAAWTAGKLFEKALARVSASATVTAQDVVTGLYKLHDETLGGLAPPLNFLAGKPAPGAPCYFGVQISSGKWSPLNNGQAYC